MCKKKGKTAPPTVDIAAQMFMGYSREYLELVPVLTSFPVYMRSTVPDNEWTRAVRRVAILHTGLGRKFTTRGEAAHIPWLIRRILDERGVQLPPEVKSGCEGVLADACKSIELMRLGTGSVGHVDGPSVTSGDHWFDVLYGDIMHSDYDRWARRGEAAWTPVFMHLRTELSEMRDLLCEMRWVVTQLAQIGALEIGDYDLTPGEQIRADDWTREKVFSETKGDG